jgi:hypothetical protein
MNDPHHEELSAREEEERDWFVIHRLTPKQKQRVYEIEKKRLEETGPLLSAKQKVLIGVYIFGCTMMYFGIPQATIHFASSQEWKYQPESDILWSLLGAGIELLRPFLAVVICGWILIIVSIIPWLLYILGFNVFGVIKKIFK